MSPTQDGRMTGEMRHPYNRGSRLDVTAKNKKDGISSPLACIFGDEAALIA